MKNEDILEMNSGKKFDICLMNPPYDRSLHLRFLEKVIQLSTNTVSIQPASWIQDPVAKYKSKSKFKKYQKSIIDHLKDVEVIDMREANDNFGIAINADVAIYHCDVNHTSSCDLPYTMNEDILSKVLSSKHKLSDCIEYNKLDGWRWQAIDIQPIIAQGGKKFSYGWFCRFCIYNHLRSLVYKDGYRGNKFWSSYNSGIRKKEGEPMPISIKFDTENEAINFENSLKTTFYHYLVYNIKIDQHVPFGYLPFMDDYTKPWTNKRFYDYFKLTDDEISEIENSMKEIETEANEYLNKKFNK